MNDPIITRKAEEIIDAKNKESKSPHKLHRDGIFRLIESQKQHWEERRDYAKMSVLTNLLSFLGKWEDGEMDHYIEAIETVKAEDYFEVKP